MESQNRKFKTVDEYFAAFVPSTRVLLKKMREAIREAAPQAEEVISYNMPAVKLNGVVVWYAAYKEHIGFYPTPSAIHTFADDLVKYKTSKGAIQFPIGKPIPTTLVKKIVKFRIKQNLEKAKTKVKSKN